MMQARRYRKPANNQQIFKKRISFRAGVSKLRPAGQIWPANVTNQPIDEFSKRMLGQTYSATSLQNIDNRRKIKVLLALRNYWSNQYGPNDGKFGDSCCRVISCSFQRPTN